jgi:hypothetical protein
MFLRRIVTTTIEFGGPTHGEIVAALELYPGQPAASAGSGFRLKATIVRIETIKPPVKYRIRRLPKLLLSSVPLVEGVGQPL